jgi:hypothetical protein
MDGDRMNTAGFYKYFSETQEILYAPNRVHTPTGSVNKETKGEIEGWKWYDSDYEAYKANNMTPLSPELSDTITKAQLKIALKRDNKLVAFKDAVAASTDEVQMWWEDTAEFSRESKKLNKVLKDGMGMNNNHIDLLFAEARSVEV